METLKIQGESELALGSLHRAVNDLAETAVAAQQAGPALKSLQRLGEEVRKLEQKILAVLAEVAVAAPQQFDGCWGGGVPRCPVRAGAGRCSASLEYVQVAEGAVVAAMVLPSGCQSPAAVRDAITGPMLCYVPEWGHFAVRLGGAILHGAVGEILPKDVCRPSGVVACKKHGAGRPHRDPRCGFYHDPAVGGQAEGCSVRNFDAASFCYGKGRRYGSASSLAADARLLSASEARLFLDQVAHDVVCAAYLLQTRPELAA